MFQYRPNVLANECRDMNDIRAEIDNIDHLVIQLLATRFDYVKAASQFKKILSMFKLKNVLIVCLSNVSFGLMS